MKIEKRELSHKEAKYFYKLIKLTPNITGHTVKQLVNYKNTYVALDNGAAIGFCVWEKISKNWCEILILYVDEKHRKMGISNSIIKYATADIDRTGLNIFTASRNPIVLNMLRKNNFKIAKLKELPLELKIFLVKYSLNGYRISEYFRKNAFTKEKPFPYGVYYKK